MVSWDMDDFEVVLVQGRALRPGDQVANLGTIEKINEDPGGNLRLYFSPCGAAGRRLWINKDKYFAVYQAKGDDPPPPGPKVEGRKTREPLELCAELRESLKAIELKSPYGSYTAEDPLKYILEMIEYGIRQVETFSKGLAPTEGYVSACTKLKSYPTPGGTPAPSPG